MSSSIKILIVDDDALNRFLLRHMLEQEGYHNCIEAVDGTSAIAACQSEKPDLVLLDVIMPDISGYDVAPQIKALSPEQYLPIIFITSLEDKAALVRCLNVGGDDFVSKPFDKLVLAAKISAHTRIRHLGQHIEKQNQRLRQHQLTIDREHTIVEHIFNNVVRRSQQLEQHFDVSASPAAQFCGDVCLHTMSPDGGAYYLIGDFTGHGLASAIGVLPVSRTFNTLTQQGLAVEQIAKTLNRILLDLLPADMFFAAIIGHVDAAGTCHRLWQGGMPAVLVKSATSARMTYYDSAHMALGVLDDDEFESKCITVQCALGDELLMFTDGLVEVTGEDGQMLGEQGVESFFAKANVGATDIYHAALQYRHSDTQADDMTVMYFRCQALSHHAVSPITTIPFRLSTRLQPAQLKRPELVSELTDLLCAQESLKRVKSKLFTVLSELLNNALEHGLLNLDSSLKSTASGFSRYYQLRASRLAVLNAGEITVDAQVSDTGESLIITVSDSGAGFHTDSLSQSAGPDMAHGRGLSLIHHLCEHVALFDNGTTIKATLALNE
ncbi:fused response regulator/phosphatase [Salinimonas sp. HHU 13199]|uniref:Fused response regulator/phosphatase n=1 Tax=Salinimonas profundi TaxID=2729140 RepID=A0ABR8LII7_9ALTE|nr:fused response regulator/phosphatase [Salinimonas profundi]MBD3585135.1 fused response regulator/phosphatase [Salinimonas profundi]